MKIYCLNCNFGSIYENSKPLFCSKCGKPYIDTSNANLNKPIKKSIPVKKIQEIEENYNENDEEHVEIPQIDEASFEITNANLRPNRDNFKNIAGKGKNEEKRLKPKNKKGKNPSQKEIEQKWSSLFPKARENPVEIK